MIHEHSEQNEAKHYTNSLQNRVITYEPVDEQQTKPLTKIVFIIGHTSHRSKTASLEALPVQKKAEDIVYDS